MSGVAAEAQTIDLRVLGPLEVWAAGSTLPLGPPKQQVVLAMLAVHAGRVLGMDELVDEVWPDSPPASAVANVRSYTAGIRRLFEAAEDRRDRLVRRGSGYQLNVEPGELDLFAFSNQVAKGREVLRSGDPSAAVTAFRDGLAYWRDSMLVGLRLGRTLVGRVAVMEEERRAVTEELADTLLALNEPAEAVRILHSHVHSHALRERAYGLLMKALYRLGDVAGSLSVYAEARSVLIEQLGIEPGAELQALHRSILNGDLDLQEPRTASTMRRPPVVKPAELPADLVDFVGRDAEVEQVVALLSTPGDAAAVPTCGIVGQAGVGKTSLAVHVAHRLRAGYPDGQLFVDLRGADSHPLLSTEVLARFLRSLGIPGEAIPHDVDERAALYRSLLADRRLLVALDNAADEEQVRPLLPGTSSCAVLVTSRYRLAGLVGLAFVDLGILSTDSALALLGKAAGAERVRTERSAAEELTRLCGGLPLALRVVGVKLAIVPHRTLSSFVERLAEERHRLDHLAHAGLAVRSSLDFSYRRIDPADQMLLRRASLLDAPDFAAWTAAAIADQTVPVVEEGLDRLVAAHLVQIVGTDAVGQLRYRMHDLIRVYARERATAEDSESDRLGGIQRTLHHWLRLATAGEEMLYGNSFHARVGHEIGHAVLDRAALDRVSVDPLKWIDAERMGLVSAVRQAAQFGMLAECWRLACVPVRLLGYREFRDEAEALHRIALDAARRLNDRRGEATALTFLGKIESERGDWAKARSLLERAEAMFVAEEDKLGLAVCHWELTYQDRYEGRLGIAKDRYMAMIQTSRGVDPAMEAMGLRGLGQIHLFVGDPEAALPLLESALAASGRCTGVIPRLLVLQWYGEACLQLGRTTPAAAAFHEVATWSEQMGALTGEILSVCGLARVALAEGDIGEAERLAVRADGRCRLLCEPSSSLVASFTKASVNLAQGSLTLANKHATEALGYCRQLGAVVHEARTLDLMAEIHEAAGDHESAAAARAEAAALQPTT